MTGFRWTERRRSEPRGLRKSDDRLIGAGRDPGAVRARQLPRQLRDGCTVAGLMFRTRAHLASLSTPPVDSQSGDRDRIPPLDENVCRTKRGRFRHCRVRSGGNTRSYVTQRIEKESKMATNAKP